VPHLTAFIPAAHPRIATLLRRLRSSRSGSVANPFADATQLAEMSYLPELCRGRTPGRDNGLRTRTLMRPSARPRSTAFRLCWFRKVWP